MGHWCLTGVLSDSSTFMWLVYGRGFKKLASKKPEPFWGKAMALVPGMQRKVREQAMPQTQMLRQTNRWRAWREGSPWASARGVWEQGHISARTHLLPLVGCRTTQGLLSRGWRSHIEDRGSPRSPAALRLLTQHDVDEGDKEGTQSKAHLDYLEQM